MKFGTVFLALLVGSGAWALLRRGRYTEAHNESPIAGNQRLTALSGLIIYGLLAAIAVTVIDVKGLLTEHYVVGFLLLPPVLLKLGSTGYRFVRYYQGDRTYRLAGAPPLLMRFVVAPVLVVSTVSVFGTGLELWLFGLRFGAVWLPLHTASAVVMLLAVAAHLPAHLPLSTATLMTGTNIRERGRLSPRSLVGGCLLLGAVMAVAALLYPSPFGQSFGGG